MADTFGFDMDTIKAIIRSNNTIKKTTQTCVQDFLTVQAEFLEKVNEIYCRLGTVEHVADIFIDQEKKDILDEYQPLEEVQLAVCGYNNSGKTSFIHELLGLGDFLPAGEGAVTARIVKFSHASPETACLIQHTSVNDFTEIERPISLSNSFMNNMTKKAQTKDLRKLIRKHLARPEDMDKNSDDFEKWAKTFIEIRIPSPILELGLHIYDTPGFLGSDPPILRHNLLELVGSVHPILIFLYENATVADDSRTCYEKLKEALRSQLFGVDIFFLNTKADVTVIRKNASNQDDDDDDGDDDGDGTDDDHDNELLKKERLNRYNLLLNVDEMMADISNANESGQAPSLELCQCFDIFSTMSPADPMEKLMKRQAVDRIIHYAADHDLQPTKLVINIVHTAIDTFFDFVLVTNRRLPEEWEKLRDEALQWGEHFFKAYRDTTNRIAVQANRRLPERFYKKYDDIKKKISKDCETRSTEWNERVDNLFRLGPHANLNCSAGLYTHCRYRIQQWASWKPEYECHDQNFIDMLLEREVIKPVLQQIISEESEYTKQTVDKELIRYRNKNELLYAAHRETLIDIDDFYDNNHFSIGQIVGKVIGKVLLTPIFLVYLAILSPLLLSTGFIISKLKTSAAQDIMHRRLNFSLDYLSKYKTAMPTMGDHIEKQIIEWIGNEHNKFRKKVNGYFEVVCRTIKDRHQAYELARSFAPRFARIECRLQANLNLAAHYGSHPVVDQQIVLGAGGFFTVHPATWGSENELVAKKLRDPIMHPDIAYLEAHFHRTATSLDIPHMVHLKYLYEENESVLYLLLSRYDTDLHSFLRDHMKTMTADKAIQIVHDIADVIAHMHAHDLVHRDIKVQNILMDKQEQVYLADFGTCQHGTENNTFIGSRPFPPDLTTLPSSIASSSGSSHEHSYRGTAVDIYLLGMLMYACAPKDTYVSPSDSTPEQIYLLDRRRVPESYCQLISRCLNKDSKNRPTARQIVDELNVMAEQLCIICEGAPRFVRFEPCGHKVVCVGCLDRIRQKSGRPQCIMCNQVFTSIREDNDASTFIAGSKNSA